MNKYQILISWIILAAIIFLAMGTCNQCSTKSTDTEKDEKIARLERLEDSLNNVIAHHKSKVDTFEVKRDVVRVVYRDRIKEVRSMDSSQHNILFDSLYAGRKDSANVKFYQNEQCQKELAYCDSSNMEKDSLISAHEQKDIVQDSTATVHKEDAAKQKKLREDDAYKLYLWKSIGKALIATDIFVILTFIALR